MAKQSVGGRIDPQLKVELDRRGDLLGKNQSQMIEAAIAAYLGKTSPDSIRSLTRRLSQMEKTVQQLQEVVANLVTQNLFQKD